MVNTIHPADIETELEKIWSSLQGANRMRACLFNLIIYARKSQRVSYLNEMTQKMIEKFPCRIIFVTYDESCSSHELATAASIMTAGEGKDEIACDLIEIEVCAKDHPKVPFVILPHILPDLPIYLVYADDPAVENPIAEKLEHLADRIIFDSEATSDLGAFAEAVLSHNHRCHGDVADLSWARIEGWKQLFASVFKRKEPLKDIKDAQKIQIRYNSQETDGLCHTNVQSIYLQGWLCAQLGWLLTKASKGEYFQYEGPSGKIEVELIPDKMEPISAGRILSVEIKTNREIEYRFSRKKEYPYHITIEKSSPEFCALPTHYVLDKDVSGQSLVKEICHKGTSAHYIKMLKLLSMPKRL